MFFMKSHGILNKNYRKFQKKIFFDFFSNFKNLIWATYCAFGNTPDLLQMEKTQTVHLAKKNWNFIQGLIGKISQMCFGC